MNINPHPRFRAAFERMAAAITHAGTTTTTPDGHVQHDGAYICGPHTRGKHRTTWAERMDHLGILEDDQ